MDQVQIDGYPFINYWLKDGRRLPSGLIREPSQRLLKLFLIDKFKVCYFCGIEVIDFIPTVGHGLVNNAATIDHLIPKPTRKRYQKVKKVLACHGCNHDRNIQAQRVGH